jgi:hypothetical protein
MVSTSYHKSASDELLPFSSQLTIYLPFAERPRTGCFSMHSLCFYFFLLQFRMGMTEEIGLEHVFCDPHPPMLNRSN